MTALDFFISLFLAKLFRKIIKGGEEDG